MRTPIVHRAATAALPLAVALMSLVPAGASPGQTTVATTAAPAAASGLLHVLLSGVLVDDSTNRPLPGGIVVLLDSAGEMVSKRARSDSSGRFDVTVAAAGRYRLLVQRAGYTPVISGALAFDAGELVEMELPLAVSGPPRTPATVIGREAIPRVHWVPEAFERRRAGGRGAFAGPRELRRTRPRPLGQLLARLGEGWWPRAASADGPAAGEPAPARLAATGAAAGSCAPAWFLEGRPAEDDEAGAMPLLNTAELRAVEVYRVGEAPAELGGRAAACGAVVVWVR